jgi:hypothetical protein
MTTVRPSIHIMGLRIGVYSVVGSAVSIGHDPARSVAR